METTSQKAAPPQRATDIFSYLDYRLFLKDLIKELKKKKKYKVRAFAFKAGIRTPGYMKMIIDGKRNLTLKMAQSFSRALGIKGREKIYFEKLILYNHEKDPDLKKEYFDDLMALKPRTDQHTLDKKQYRYFSRTYYACIQEMVALPDFNEDPKWIAERCYPPIRVSQAKEALETLIELGFVKRGPDGRLFQTERLIQTEAKNTQIAETFHYHESVINKARKALSAFDQHERHCLAVTMPLNEQLYQRIVEESCGFRDRIIKLVQEESGGGEIYQMNFQLFPMTKKKEGQGP